MFNYRETENGFIDSQCCGFCQHSGSKDVDGVPCSYCNRFEEFVCLVIGTCDKFSRRLDNCPICKRVVPEERWEKHHLIPKSKGGKKVVDVCVSCGDMIHKLIPLNLLKKEYNTVEKLLDHPDIQKWIKWIQKKPNDFSICMRSKKRK